MRLPLAAGRGGILSMANTALSYLPPGMAQAAQAGLAAFSAVWKAIKSPSEAELKARRDVDDYEAVAIEGLSDAQLAEAAAAGWESVADAGFLIKIRDQYVEVGLSAQQAETDVNAYWAAIESGDIEAINAQQAEWDALGLSIDEVAAGVTAAWEASSSAAASAFYKAEDAGTTAYDKILTEALIAEVGQKEAVARATAASLAATAKVLAAEGLKYARIAGFDAAMALGAHATQAERNAAAATAAAGAIASWDAAMVAVTASDLAATDAMKQDWTGPAGVQQETEAASTAAQAAWEAGATEIQRVSGVMAEGVKGDLVGIRDSARARFGEIVSAAQDAANAIEFESIWPDMTREMANDMARMAASSIASIGTVVDGAERMRKAVSSASSGGSGGEVTTAGWRKRPDGCWLRTGSGYGLPGVTVRP